jgi:hypothetical protein
MQGYIKASKGPFIPVHYNVYVEASMQGYKKGSRGPSYWFIIMAN